MRAAIATGGCNSTLNRILNLSLNPNLTLAAADKGKMRTIKCGPLLRTEVGDQIVHPGCYLSIPATSLCGEQLFSIAGAIISARRSSLSAATVESLLLRKEMLK